MRTIPLLLLANLFASTLQESDRPNAPQIWTSVVDEDDEFVAAEQSLFFHAGDSVTLSCLAPGPAEWSLPKYQQWFLDSTLQLDDWLINASEISVGHGDETNYFNTSLFIEEISYLHTGYFTCSYSQEDNRTAESRVYIFVRISDYSNLLAVPPSSDDTLYLRDTGTDELLVPCRPAIPSVKVQLSQTDQNGQECPSLLQRIISFDERHGFRVSKVPEPTCSAFRCLAKTTSFLTIRDVYTDNTTKMVFTPNRTTSDEEAFQVASLGESQVVVLEGQDVTFSVRVIFSRRPRLQWERSKYLDVKEMSHNETYESDNTLITQMTIFNVQGVDQGTYTCRILHALTEELLVFNLTVRYAPIFDKWTAPNDVVLRSYNQSKEFFWSATSELPLTSIQVLSRPCTHVMKCNETWSIQTASITTDSNWTQGSQEDDYRVRVISERIGVYRRLQKEGEYSVHLCNEAGCRQGQIETLGKSEVANDFSIKASSATPHVGDKFNLTCKVSLYTYKKNISWSYLTKVKEIPIDPNSPPFVKEIPIDPNSPPFGARLVDESADYNTSHVQTLSWSQIPASAQRSFICRSPTISVRDEDAFDIYYSDKWDYDADFHSRAKKYDVRLLDASAPSFTAPNGSEINILLNGELRLECDVQAAPPPIIDWARDGIAMAQLQNQTTLHFPNVMLNDSGIYTCAATNRLGTANKTFRVRVLEELDEYRFVKRIVPVAAGVILILVSALAWRIHKEKKRKRLLQLKQLKNFIDGQPDSIQPDLPLTEQSEFLPYDPRWEFPRHRLQLGPILGRGAFGVVVRGTAIGILSSEPMTEVAVKMPRSLNDMEGIKALICELKILIHLGPHLNVVNLLGACTAEMLHGELLVVTEYCLGNLRDYLLNNRHTFVSDKEGSLNSDPNDSCSDKGFANFHFCFHTDNLISWSFQIARGMGHLTSKKVFHGDLAARNILLAENNVVKIADFGLSRKLYQLHYKKQSHEPLPIKWMAIESLVDGVFSSKSDVWSFGVLLWEIFSLGATPYPELTEGKEFIEKLQGGYRMDKPQNSPQTIFSMMTECWQADPQMRPDFGHLEHELGSQLTSDVRQYYIDLSEEHGRSASTGANQRRRTSPPPTYLQMMPEEDELREA